MRIIVAGAGKLGRRVAEIIKEKNTVIVIERDEARARYIEDLLHVTVVRGDANDPSVLLEAGADRSDVLVAATSDDEDNLVVCMLAKYEFKIKKVVGAVRNPKNQWLYNRSWGVDVSIDSAQLVANLIEEEATLCDIVTLMKLRQGEIIVTEYRVPSTSKVLGKVVTEIKLPERTIVGAVIRGTEIFANKPDVTIEADDELLLVTNPDVVDSLPSFFA
jgi:trk system potassium uptake protein TrkA